MLAVAAEQTPSLPGHTDVTQWQQWLASSVGQLANANLLRSLHPVRTTLSPVEVSCYLYQLSTTCHFCAALTSVALNCIKVDLSNEALAEWLDSTGHVTCSANILQELEVRTFSKQVHV